MTTPAYEMILDGIVHQPGSEMTQIMLTKQTYAKVASLLKVLVNPGQRVLDYGAGLGYGTQELRAGLGQNITVESYEPAPESNREAKAPTYRDSDHIKKKYDAIVCLNVLNVLERRLRDDVVKNIFSLLAPNGILILGTRAWSGDIKNTVRGKRGDEPKSMWIKREKRGQVTWIYQKGFDRSELADYVRSLIHEPLVTKPLSGITANGWLIKREATDTKTTPITEAMNRPQPWKWTIDEDEDMVAEFHIPDGRQFQVVFNAHVGNKNFWEMSFQTSDRIQVNAGGQFDVFSTIIDVLKDFLELREPRYIYFTSDARDKSRVLLYTRFAKNVARINPRYTGGVKNKGAYVTTFYIRGVRT